MKKIAVIGRGTAGCLAVAQSLAEHFLVDWYYDPEIPAWSVGEGSTIELPSTLERNVGFLFEDLIKCDGSLKVGIKKTGWGQINDNFFHQFGPGSHAYHFNASVLQDFLQKKLKDRYNDKLKFIEMSVKLHDLIDSDYIIDCRGKPAQLNDFVESNYIPVNSVYVTQCYWEYSKFPYTLTIARPYGWVFGIPLQNRCSIGYLYNNKINTLEEIQEDVKIVFEDYNLTPSSTTNAFDFQNYQRKSNWSGRIAYNGTASFFFEPLEATSLSCINQINNLSISFFKNKISEKHAQDIYNFQMSSSETVIMLHYLAGSQWNTEFWQYAKERAIQKIKNIPEFPEIFRYAMHPSFNTFTPLKPGLPDKAFGTWAMQSLNSQIKLLGIEGTIREILNLGP